MDTYRRRGAAWGDRQLIMAVAVLVAFGLFILASASWILGFDKFHDSFYFIKHQILFGIVPGLLVFGITARISAATYRKLAPILFGGAVVLLIGVLTPGIGTQLGGARSWFTLFGASFQPAEVARRAVSLMLARWVENRGAEI